MDTLALALPQPISAPRTSQEWTAVIDDLAARLATREAELTGFTKEKAELSLAVEALHDPVATKRLQYITREYKNRQTGTDQLRWALEDAGRRRAEVLEIEAAAAESKRREDVGSIMSSYYAEMEELDFLLQTAAEHFTAGAQFLLQAEERMTSQERGIINQLPARSRYPTTLALAYHGLDKFVELGPSAQFIQHRKPLAEISKSIAGGWLKPEPQPQPIAEPQPEPQPLQIEAPKEEVDGN